MGWVEDQLEENRGAEKRPGFAHSAAENAFQAKAKKKWDALLSEFREDVEELSRIIGSAEFDRLSDLQCRISNPRARIAVLVTADLSQHAIGYTYEPEDSKTAVPEQGMLTLRPSGDSVDLYSADEQMTSEQARKLVLEPLLFSNEHKRQSSAA